MKDIEKIFEFILLAFLLISFAILLYIVVLTFSSIFSLDRRVISDMLDFFTKLLIILLIYEDARSKIKRI